MKKFVSLFFVVLMLFVSVYAGASEMKDGTYEAKAGGFGGPVVVTLTINDGKIANVVVAGEKETAAIGGKAVEALQSRIMEEQSADIDGVSGATITSNAVKIAAKGAFDKAAGKETQKRAVLKDGTYSVASTGYSWTGMIKADVMIKDDHISNITITEEHESDTGEIAQTAFDHMIPRLIKNQSLATDVITGATATSNSIKALVSQAIIMAGGDPADWSGQVAKEEKTVTLEGYDVIVVGLGGSGILSYCAAAEQGAKVFGIETAAKLGGQTATTTGPMIIGSKAEAFKDVEFPDLDEVYQTWIEYVGDEKKADIIKEAVYNNGKYIDYYINNFDFEFSGVIPSFAKREWSKMWTRFVGESNNIFGANKTSQFNRAIEKAVAMNEKNGYQLELTAKELIFNDNKITGVRCVAYDGTVYEIYGDSVILATGGFVGNDKMMKENFGRSLNTIASTVNDGTGIAMGLSAGGTTFNLNVDPMIHIMQVPNMIKNDDLTADQKAILTALALVSGEKMVTVDGVDLDPSLTGVTVLSMIPGYQYYVVYSQEQMEQFKEKGLTENFATAGSHFMGQGGIFEVNKPIEDLDKILEVAMKYGNIVKADSIDNLAEMLEIDKEKLGETLGGVDTTYYAVIVTGYTYGTVGGLDVNVSMNVLREDGTPIENLYAVGADSMGVENVVGKPYTPWGGQANAWNFVSGYLAGHAAAAYGMDK